MTTEDFSAKLEAQIIAHEGLFRLPYRCTAGKLTIGVGRNLDDVGIRESEAMVMFRNDLAEATTTARNAVPNFDRLSSRRRMALIDMAFNLGARRLSGFLKMRSALAEGDFEGAAREMENSAWYQQVGNRAKTLTAMMREG